MDITPFLWFDDNAEEAANFYVSLFKDAKIQDVTRYGEAGPGPNGSVMTISFQLQGQDFVALNGGPEYTFSMATSFFISCETQSEVDVLWEKLSAGGKKSRCGWLTDKFGVTWQVVPQGLIDVLGDDDPEKAKRAMEAMMKMDKLDINRLREAAEAKV